MIFSNAPTRINMRKILVVLGAIGLVMVSLPTVVLFIWIAKYNFWLSLFVGGLMLIALVTSIIAGIEEEGRR